MQRPRSASSHPRRGCCRRVAEEQDSDIAEQVEVGDMGDTVVVVVGTQAVEEDGTLEVGVEGDHMVTVDVHMVEVVVDKYCSQWVVA